MASPNKLSNLQLRRYFRQLGKYELVFRNAVFPLTPNGMLYVSSMLALLHALNLSPLDGAVSFINDFTGIVISSILISQSISFLLVLLPVMFCAVFIVRMSFTVMLYYRGWLFEEIGKPPSLPTKIFMMVVSFVNRHAVFFSYRNLLPWLPIPKISDTIPKYLETVEPFLSKEEYDVIRKQAKDFVDGGMAGQLQNKLWMKWIISPNWVSDWWKEVVYMRYRDSLINTNVGCADIIFKQPTTSQAARAAVTTWLRLRFCHEYFDKQTTKGVGLGPIPLCPSQYMDYYRTIRVPKHTSDVMERLADARHVAINHKGAWYKVPIHTGKRWLRPAEMERAFENVLARTDEPKKGESHLGALTAGPRELWARIREEKFNEGYNLRSLTMIETALEVMYFDDEERVWDESDITKYEREYQRTLTGDGYKLWCDLPSVSIFSKNGRFTTNAEHSVVDAMIYVHIREYIKYHEQFSNLYTPDGHAAGVIEQVPAIERAEWYLDKEIRDAIDQAFTVSKAVSDDFENAAVVYFDYGKDFIKKARVSPDAYIQMALQLTYFKDQGRFDLTYEPAVMRLFRDGRTETVRSCSNQSCAFVRAMLDEKTSDAEKLRLLKLACDRHQDYYRNAMAGRGVDRHLFGLYVVSKYYEMSSPFLDNVFSMSYALSSSQTPQHQSVEYSAVLNKERELFWPAGAFACPDGSKYGVCYTIGTTGDMMSFHISSKKSFKDTDCHRFRSQLLDSLREMREMVEAATAKQ
ncbi:unnamed protein product, partial [Mesorhabditis spiculigera]